MIALCSVKESQKYVKDHHATFKTQNNPHSLCNLPSFSQNIIVSLPKLLT